MSGEELASGGEWREWIGRSTSRTEVLEVTQANRMNVTLDREPTRCSATPR